MKQDQEANPVPFRLEDEPSLDGEEPPKFEDIGVNAIGHIASPRGVELVAVDSRPDEAVWHDMTTIGWVFHMFVSPPKAMLQIDNGPEMQMPRFFFLPPNLPMRWRSAPAVNSMCLFGPEFVSGLLGTEPALGFDALDCVMTKESKRLAFLGQEILRESLSPGFGAGLFAEAIATEVAVEIVRHDRAYRPDEALLRGGLAPWQMRRLETYVREHLSNDLSLEALAAVLEISVRHLSRVVKHDKGMSVHRWVAELRLAEAQRLLAQTSTPLHEIARRVAFNSAAAFSSAFRAASGLSPSEYRRLAL